MSALISVVVILVIVGLILWLVNSYLPIDARIKQLINAVVIIFTVLWLIVKFLVPMI